MAATALTVEAGLQDDWGLQAQALDDGVLDTLRGRGGASKEGRSWKVFPEALQRQVGWPTPTLL